MSRIRARILGFSLLLLVCLLAILGGLALWMPNRTATPNPTPTPHARYSAETAIALVGDRLAPGVRLVMAEHMQATLVRDEVWSVTLFYAGVFAQWEVYEHMGQALPVNNQARSIEAWGRGAVGKTAPGEALPSIWNPSIWTPFWAR